MRFQQEENRIFALDETGALLAEVSFPAAGEGLVEIDHTFVDGSLRGRGVAGQLLEEAVQALRATGRKAVLSCPYAQKWFAEHPEQGDLLFR